jgi:hypothetical protein
VGRDGEVLARPERGAAQSREVEPGHAFGRLRHDQAPPRHSQALGPGWGAAGQLQERGVQLAPGARVGRHVPGAQPAQPVTPEVADRVHLQHVEVLVQQRDEW